jgi:septal ring factor EnvC (AmiA/AmiB activator)
MVLWKYDHFLFILSELLKVDLKERSRLEQQIKQADADIADVEKELHQIQQQEQQLQQQQNKIKEERVISSLKRL